jgi:hypothetical protein
LEFRELKAFFSGGLKDPKETETHSCWNDIATNQIRSSEILSLEAHDDDDDDDEQQQQVTHSQAERNGCGMLREEREVNALVCWRCT